MLGLLLVPISSRGAAVEMEMTGTTSAVDDPLGLISFAHPADHDLSAFASRSFQVIFRGPPVAPGSSQYHYSLFYGTIDSFVLVPEPASLLLMLSAAGVSFYGQLLRKAVVS
jgi:hypothetical protein